MSKEISIGGSLTKGQGCIDVSVYHKPKRGKTKQIHLELDLDHAMNVAIAILTEIEAVKLMLKEKNKCDTY